MPHPRLGFIGIGLMGDPMTRRLLEAGFDVTVWNRTPAKAAPLGEAGARMAGSIAELVEEVDVVLLCLANTAVVEDVVFGDGGVAQHGRAGQRLVDLSSSDPAATRDFADWLESECGMRWVDAPVSGGVTGAEAGSLAIMCGGDAEDIEAIRPLLAPLSARVTHMGPVGSGQVTKVCNQMVVGCQAAVLAEMVALAEASGVDATRLVEALSGGFADSTPFRILTPRMATSDFADPPWHLRTLLKDLDMAVAQSQRSHSATPMSGLAAQLMRAQASRGHAEHDPAILVEAYRPSRRA
ncbi:NAD(P)-dependent oxidoreductase [Halomonas ventosae]|uniref:3-hydroxyisobutyrate dehydrogenase n=1 Tax=Halomonas ventosae TaxID=229007 RepID=A0A2T0VSP9_9GAMM|nr:NAD(P)-dependent oxidoreductase [Halomonas ventosae]PRY73649.1 3-hydroxyisobutyrate dehydrogenase [Halomonas ventosae]